MTGNKSNLLRFLGIWIATLAISNAAAITASSTNDIVSVTSSTAKTTTVGPQTMSSSSKTILAICVGVFVGVPALVVLLCVLKSFIKCDQQNNVDEDQEKMKKFRRGCLRKVLPTARVEPATNSKDGIPKGDQIAPREKGDPGYESQNYENQDHYWINGHEEQGYEGYENGTYGVNYNGEYNYEYNYDYDPENAHQPYDYSEENVGDQLHVEDYEGDKDNSQDASRVGPKQLAGVDMVTTVPTPSVVGSNETNDKPDTIGETQIKDTQNDNVNNVETDDTKEGEKKKKRKERKIEEGITEENTNAQQDNNDDKAEKKKRKKKKMKDKEGEVVDDNIDEREEKPEKKKKKKKKDTKESMEKNDVEVASDGDNGVENTKKKKTKKKKKNLDGGVD